MKKFRFLLEIPLFYTLFAAANWFLFPHLPGFLEIDPHPFWIGVLLFGFRYGVVAGFFSGFLSTVVYLTTVWLGGEQYRFEELNFFILPGFFILFGLLIGTLADKGRREIRDLKIEREEAKKEKRHLQEEIITLQEVNRSLEKRIVSRMATLVTLYEGARRLEQTETEKLYPALVQFIAKTLEAEEASLYLKTAEGWQLHTKHGWKEFYRRPLILKWNEGLIGIAGSSNRVVSIRDFLGKEEKPGISLPEIMGESLLAGPLRDGEKGDIIGVVAIQKMPFDNFNSASLNLFSFLLNWGSRSVGQARYIEKLREQEIIDRELQVYSVSYFNNRLQQEFARSQKYYLPLCIAKIGISGFEFFSPEQKEKTLLFVSRLLKESCRESDVVARWNEKNIPFVILWATTTEEQANEMKKKILDNFEKVGLADSKIQVRLKIGVSAFHPKITNSETFLKMAQEALNG